uniref:Uncharacterized protein n=1 Tax=mine drainage metagenome TaxID=410659 RepID=E6Q239_9ZZZZ
MVGRGYIFGVEWGLGTNMSSLLSVEPHS